MKLEQIYTSCLAHAAYYLESDGIAAVFDPLRESEPYLTRAEKNGSRIKYIFETHFHADFVSGHLDLANKTGAKIVYGPTAKPAFEAVVAHDQEEFQVGKVKVTAIHTPGHTMESTTYLITDEQGKQHGIITGDTLFIGDVGRPDLAQHVIADLTEEKLARLLFHSLRTKIMTLPDHLIVYPNHGAGSACGKMMSNETSDTLGNQKKTNYALRASMTEDEFVAELLTGLTTPPAYFPKNVLMNIQGYEPIDKVLAGGLKPLSPTSFEAAAIETQALILDTRSPEAVATGFIPNSLNIGLDGNFAMWVGELISNIKKPILLVADPGREEEAVLRLARVGYDNSIGFLNGGMEAWINAEKPVNRIQRLDANNLESLPKSEYTLLDVRKASEFNSEHAENAINIPLNGLAQRIHELPPAGRLIVHCAGGYRSMIAATLLAQFGRAAEDVRGGFAEIKKTNLPVTDYVCPTTLL